MSHIVSLTSQLKAYNRNFYTDFPFIWSPYLYEKVSAGAMLLLVMIDTPWVSFIVSIFGIARRI